MDGLEWPFHALYAISVVAELLILFASNFFTKMENKEMHGIMVDVCPYFCVLICRVFYTNVWAFNSFSRSRVLLLLTGLKYNQISCYQV